MRASLASLILCLLASACSEGLPPREQIVDTRILGVRLSPPSAVAGESVVADALVITPEGQEATLTWYACLAPISTGSYFSQSIDRSGCKSGESEHGTLLGQGESASFTVPQDFMDQVYLTLEEAGFEESEGEMSTAVQSLLAVAGWYLQVTLIVESDTGERIEAQKRLVVTLLPDQNENPAPPTLVMESVEEGAPPAPLIKSGASNDSGGCLSEDSPLLTFEEGTLRISPVNLPDPAPTYPVIDFEGGLVEREETLFYSWFSSAKGLSSPVSQSPDQHPVALDLSQIESSMLVEREGRPTLPLWVVVRDGRGGTSWCEEYIPFEGELQDAEPSSR